MLQSTRDAIIQSCNAIRCTAPPSAQCRKILLSGPFDQYSMCFQIKAMERSMWKLNFQQSLRFWMSPELLQLCRTLTTFVHCFCASYISTPAAHKVIALKHRVFQCPLTKTPLLLQLVINDHLLYGLALGRNRKAIVAFIIYSPNSTAPPDAGQILLFTTGDISDGQSMHCAQFRPF
jgi:hypothetical protein